MIVRILGDGQFEVPDDHRHALGELEGALNRAVDGEDEAAFTTALAAVIADVRATGTRLAADDFTASDLVLPFADADLAETKALLAEPGGDDR